MTTAAPLITFMMLLLWAAASPMPQVLEPGIVFTVPAATGADVETVAAPTVTAPTVTAPTVVAPTVVTRTAASTIAPPPAVSTVVAETKSLTYADTKVTGPGFCGPSSFENRTSIRSPFIVDCRHLVDNISHGGKWDIDVFLGRQRRIADYGTCAFGVQGHSSSPGERKIFIGYEDVIDLINDSIEKFTWDGQMGAKGIMECKDDRNRDRIVEWGIYRT